MAVFRFVEKRRSPRVKLKTELRYKLRGGIDNLSAVSENISLGGIGFISGKFIPPDSRLMLNINLLSKVLNPVGRVVSAVSLPHSDRYRVGVEFVELEQPQRNYLSDYISLRRENF